MPADLQDTLLRWFKTNRRDLPWRKQYSPYEVWISEIMLQQTQMDRATAYFLRWMERFPDVQAVAAAREREILKLWEGLGYYSRARNLHKAADIISKDYGGVFPREKKDILALPGIGAYTAAAIMSMAFQEDEAVVDANVERVYARIFDVDAPLKTKEAKKRFRDLAVELLPPGKARDYNQAVMEFGALVCRPKSPDCGNCPVNSRCEALRLGITADRPVPGKGVDIVTLEVATGVLVHDKRIFIQKRLPKGAWAGLWEFPGGSIEAGETPEIAVVREYAEETAFEVDIVDKAALVRHGYTRFRVNLHCFLLRLKSESMDPLLTAAQKASWVSSNELDEYAFPAGHRKLIDLMRRDVRFASFMSS
jgi:A/G-specific adenine glycosylase